MQPLVGQPPLLAPAPNLNGPSQPPTGQTSTPAGQVNGADPLLNVLLLLLFLYLCILRSFIVLYVLFLNDIFNLNKNAQTKCQRRSNNASYKSVLLASLPHVL